MQQSWPAVFADGFWTVPVSNSESRSLGIRFRLGYYDGGETLRDWVCLHPESSWNDGSTENYLEEYPPRREVEEKTPQFEGTICKTNEKQGFNGDVKEENAVQSKQTAIRNMG